MLYMNLKIPSQIDLRKYGLFLLLMITPSSWGNVNRTFTAITLAGTSKRNFDERSKKQNPFEKANMKKVENCKKMQKWNLF